MESPKREMLKFPLNRQIASEHVTVFRNGGAKEARARAR